MLILLQTTLHSLLKIKLINYHVVHLKVTEAAKANNINNMQTYFMLC